MTKLVLEIWEKAQLLLLIGKGQKKNPISQLHFGSNKAQIGYHENI